ncbi:MAG: LPS export ABC transporter permease LptF [Rhodospirillales bacterium]|nr:MAG: LPS export ABC transporter permease LptF [Rhodospirillales bacterium]
MTSSATTPPLNGGWLSRIDRYVLERTLVPLGASIAIALVALLMDRMVRLMELMVSQGGPILLVLKLLANLIPHYLGLALPLALFLGVTLTAARLSGDSELDALQSAGVGLTRLLRPILWLTALLTLVMIVLIGWLQPLTRYQFRALMWAATNSAWDLAMEKGSFFNGLGNFTVLIEDIAPDGRTLKGVFVHQRKPDGGAITMTAETGEAARLPDDGQILLKLRNGRRVESHRDSEKLTVLSFDRFDLPMEVAAGDSYAPPIGERVLTMTELVCQLHLNGALFSKRRADVATGGAPWDWVCPTGAKRHDYRGRRLQSEMHSRLVRMLSLLCLPFMAMSLGLASRRSQRAVGLVAGVVMLAFYNYLLQFGEKGADYGKIPPWLGLWTPFVLNFAFSVWLFWIVKERPRDNPVEAAFAATERLRESAAGGLRRVFGRG